MHLIAYFCSGIVHLYPAPDTAAQVRQITRDAGYGKDSN